MIINLNNPCSKFINICCTFHVIAYSTTRNYISLCVPFIIVNSVQAIKYITTIYSFWLINLIRFCSTIMTRLFSNPPEELPTNIPCNSSIPSIIFCLPIKRTKCSFSLWKTLSASTAFRKSSSQGVTFCNFCISTFTLAKIHYSIIMVASCSFYHLQFSKLLANHVYKFSHFSSLIGASRSASRYWCHAIQAKRDAYETKIRQTVFA